MSKQSEYIKCYQDKSRIYFIENYLYTFNAMERSEVPFLLFPRQKEYLRACAEDNEVVTVKCRQSGISTVSAAYICGQCVFANKKSPETILCIANKLDQAIELTNKIANFLDQVPRWMWGSDYYSPDPDSSKNTKSIYIKRNKNYIELFNGCKIYARASGPHSARGVSSTTILCLDEAAFLADSVAAYTSARASQSAVENPKCLMISTPNGKDPLYYKTYSQALRGENNFRIVEFKFYQDPRYNRYLKWYKKDEKTGEILWDEDPVIDKKGNIEYNEERWRNLEKNGWTPTSPWFEDMCKSFNNDEQMIAQELLVSFLGSSDNVVSPEVIEMHQNENVIQITPDWPLRDQLISETWIWQDPIPGHRYIVSVDPSSGSGEDRTAIEVIDVDAIDENGTPFFDQVLEYNGKINGEEIAGLVDRYGHIYNDALVVVEAIGGYGDAVILTLMNLGYPNLYYDENALKNYTLKVTASKFNKKAGEALPGFRSNGLRIQMISNFVEMLKNNSFRVRSTRVISELETWVFKNGRPDHQDGSHDDSLTCLAMGLFIAVFYMLRNEKVKQKDTQIVKSWYVNNGNNSDYRSSKLEDKVVMSSPKKMPFYSNVQMAKKEKARFNAMLLLGGFGRKKH